MSIHHITREQRPKFSILQFVLLGLAALALVVGLPAFQGMRVTVDGVQHRLPPALTASDAVVSGLVSSSPGDLVDVGGKVLSQGGGLPPILVRNGERLSSAEVLEHGDRLVSVSGSDLLEARSETASPIPLKVEYRGDGPLEDVVQQGHDGLLVTRTGELSGKIANVQVEVAAVSTVIERRLPRRGDKVVALTFDDGPVPGATEEILDMLEREDVPATFFVVGNLAHRYHGIVKRTVEEGHQVENHSYSHRILTRADEKLAHRELVACQNEIQKLTGRKPRWFRPPGGKASDEVYEKAKERKMFVIGWDVDPQDWRRPEPKDLARETIAAVQPGSVVLLHDGGGDRSATIAALPTIIRELKKRGYIFLTLDEMGGSLTL